MSKVQTIFSGCGIIIDKFIENGGIPYSDMYRITVFDRNNKYKDEIVLTEKQWDEIKKLLLITQCQGTSPCSNPIEESEYDFSNPGNVVAKINYAKDIKQHKDTEEILSDK